MAKVCNPIYDTVFKYLVEDKRVAKVLLGGILGKNIVDVAIKSHEHIIHKGNDLQLLRIDFAATIENADGTKETATIELQKASEPEEVMRFRQYFGIQMSSEENADVITKHHRDKEKTPYQILKPRHIYGIFILGHSLGKGYEYPLIKGNTVFYDEDDNVLKFETQCEFLRGMTYDLYIIQIPHLPARPRRPLEDILRAFDQRYKVKNNSKFLELTEDEDEQSGFNVLYRRLLHAASDSQLRGDLDFEDQMERKRIIEEAEKEDLEYELKETKGQLQETKGQLQETKGQLTTSIKMLSSAGIPVEQIAQSLGISISDVERVIESVVK